MTYVGDIRLGDTFDVKFCTVTTTGAPTTLAGTPVISAYPGNSTTELTAGITLTVDFDARTGLNNVRIVATSGNGYATATDYQVVITTGTVGGTSVVGYVVAQFSIEKRSALMPVTAARTLVVDAAGLADATAVKLGPTGAGTAQTARDVGLSVLLSAGSGTGQLDFTSGVVKANLTQILATALTEGAGQIAAAFKKLFDVASPVFTATSVNQTGDSYARVGAPAGASVSADVAAVKAVLPAALVGGRMDSNAAVVGDKTGYAIGVGGIASTAFAASAVDAAAIAANAITSSEFAQSAAQLVADEMLNRDLVGGASGNTRGVRNALRAIRNKVAEVAGTATVYQEDDTTAAWTAVVTRTASTNAITTVDPA